MSAESARDRELTTCVLMIAALANHCAGGFDETVDCLTGYLWDEEEAYYLKAKAKEALK